jgi:hypothetical protein
VRRASNKDSNHAEVRAAFEAMGCTVENLESPTAGVPDLLVGIFGLTELVEVKDGTKPPSARKLNDAQREWHARWRGRKPVVVQSVDDAVAVVAKLRGLLTQSEVHHG